MADHTHYKKMAELARAQDGKPDVREQIVRDTVALLRDLISLDGVRCDDDGFRVLVLVGDGARGVPAQEWLDAQGGAP